MIAIVVTVGIMMATKPLLRTVSNARPGRNKNHTLTQYEHKSSPRSFKLMKAFVAILVNGVSGHGATQQTKNGDGDTVTSVAVTLVSALVATNNMPDSNRVKNDV